MRRRGSTSKLGRNATEKNRRRQMRDHLSRLAFLIPQTVQAKAEAAQMGESAGGGQPERWSSHVLLERAATYVKQLKKRTKELRRRKERLEGGGEPPKLDVIISASNLEVKLVSGLDKKMMLYEVLNAIADAGAEVVCVSYSVVGYKIFHTILSQPISTRIGVDTAVSERLKELVSRAV